MQQLADKTAVITGAAAGIGLAMAERFAREGMKVVLADIDGPALTAALQGLKAAGHDVAGQVCDVTSERSVADLADFATSTYGELHLVCNNAGIGGGAADDRPLWEASVADWKWVMDINVWGVIHGIRTFVPLLMRQGKPAHVINTASKAGLLAGTSLYSTSKHAVIAMTEGLHAQLKLAGASVGASVLCPGAVNTNLKKNSERIRPAGAPPGPAAAALPGAGTDFMADYRGTVQTRMAAGRSPADIAEMVVRGLHDGDFYILPGVQEDGPIEARFDNIRARKVVDYRKSYMQFNWAAAEERQ